MTNGDTLLVIPYMAWRGRLSFQCGTLQVKNDYKCNTWSRTKLVVLYHHWSSLIWHKEEGFPSNVGLSKLKMTTSATLGLSKNCPHILHVKYFTSTNILHGNKQSISFQINLMCNLLIFLLILIYNDSLRG